MVASEDDHGRDNLTNSQFPLNWNVLQSLEVRIPHRTPLHRIRK
jgi:hypothetical protein